MTDGIKFISSESIKIVNFGSKIKMKIKYIPFILLMMFVTSTSFGQKKCKKKKNKNCCKTETSMKLDNQLDSISYAFGVNIAENLKNQGLDSLSVKALAQGMTDFYKGDSLLIPQEEIMPMLQAYMQDLQAKKVEKMTEEGKKFLEENGKREGVITLPSGLQYEVLSSGDGPIPTASDQVTTHYTGFLIDGTVFDSSVKRGQPATFPVGGVIQGWQEALQLMHVGDKWKLYIPYNLAYGANGHPPTIPPYSTLIFEIELIAIQ